MPGLRRSFLVLALLSSLTGCEEPLPPVATPAAGTPAPVVRQLTLASLSFQTKHMIGAEIFSADLVIGQAGSGMLTHYGMATRLGEQLYPLKPNLPVIDGGKVTMTVGPLPNLTEGGPLTVEFWVVDHTGRESNRLTEEVVIQ